MKFRGLVLAMGLVSTVAMAADEWDYAVNPSNTVWRTTYGECWHMGWRDETFKPLPDCGDAPAETEEQAAEAEPAAAPAPAAEPAEAAPAAAAAAAPVVFTFDNVVFEHNSAELKDESKPVLDDVAKRINDNSDIKSITVVGHTDSSGAAAYNKDLSERRAESVVEYIKTQGVTVPMTAEGAGEERPVADNATAEGRAKNHRVEFDVYK